MIGTRIRFHVQAGLTAFLVAMMMCATCAAQQAEPKPFYQVTLVGRSLKALNYQHRSGATMIGFAGTPLLPLAKGQANVESKQGRIQIDAKFSKLQPAQKFGAGYLTYVLWAVTPEGKPTNLGEVLLNGTNSKLSVTTPLQSFGLIVTAEPYFAVSQPSEVVVLENELRFDTRATSEQIAVNYELIQRGHYVYDVSQVAAATGFSSNTPLEVYEARNAVAIARQADASKYATETFGKAQNSLMQVEDLLKRKAGKNQIAQLSRETVQTAADARAIALKREQDEHDAEERAAAAAREARAKADADAAAASQRAEAEARREAQIQQLQAEAHQRQAELDRQKAEAQQRQAELDRQRAEAQQQQAELERQKAEAQQRQAELDRERAQAQQLLAEREAATQAQARAQAEAAAQSALAQQQAALEAVARAEREKQELRAALFEQFNRILPTRDTPRGLMVNISDVLFDTAKFDLRPPAREALAKLSGIVLAHPGLDLAIEGHTDSTGTHEFNQKLSGQRADSVRHYLVQQGLEEETITAEGFAETMPVAENTTVPGRQQNRRVEIIVSGEVIGAKIAAR